MQKANSDHLLVSAESVQPAATSAWQPIETAPKDGTKVLTFGRGHGNKVFSHDAYESAFPMYGIAYWAWHDDERDVEVSPGLFRKEPCRLLEGWRTEWSYIPTHWMPLPEPPRLPATLVRPTNKSASS